MPPDTTSEHIASNVTRFQRGDEVMGTSETGSFAELAVTPQDKLVPKPARLTFEEAAALPVSGCTALQAVRDEAQVQPGQQVLVIGASGGVGSLAVQIAKALGAEVTGVCSTSKVDLVRSIGADGGGRWTGGFFRGVLRAPVVSLFVSQRLRGLSVKEDQATLLALSELIQSGGVTPVIDRTYPLIEAPDAIRYLEHGHPRGKVVMTI